MKSNKLLIGETKRLIPETSDSQIVSYNQTIRILNLYAGIGGNRKGFEIAAKKLGLKIIVTAIEHDIEIAAEYQRNYPEDIVITCDQKCEVDTIREDCQGNAHYYLLWNHENFDFIWSSPSCLTFTNINYILHNQISKKHPKGNRRYPELDHLYGEIIVLASYFKGKYVVENVKPFFVNSKQFMDPTFKLNRHFYWSNFFVPGEYSQSEFSISGMMNDRTRNKRASGRISTDWEFATVPQLENHIGLKISEEFKGDKVKVLRNCVLPEDAAHILEWLYNKELKPEPIKVSPSLEEWL